MSEPREHDGAATDGWLHRGPLAHQAEHLPFKQVVPGSSPGRLTLLQRCTLANICDAHVPIV
jgi:hypothetical protein